MTLWKGRPSLRAPAGLPLSDLSSRLPGGGKLPGSKTGVWNYEVEMQRRQVGVANVLRGCAEEPLQRQTSALATYIFSAEGLTPRLKQVRVRFIISTAQR